MSQHAVTTANPKVHLIQQVIKWTVYTLLIINWVYYIFEDANRATHILHAGSTFLDWTSEFANSIDESAWFFLLFMFELETYIVDDKHWKGWLAHTVRGVRLFCYALIAHTIFAYLMVIVDLQPTVAVENVSSLCDMVEADVSYVNNLEYTDVNEQNCGELSAEIEFYWLASDPVVSDLAGLELERDLALVDLAEAVIWLLILLAIETSVRLQDHDVTGGPLLSTANAASKLMYLSLIGIGIYWASLSHWLYLWDEVVWILGFAAIEMNISQWHDELVGETI
jgi:hypothetical protein